MKTTHQTIITESGDEITVLLPSRGGVKRLTIKVVGNESRLAYVNEHIETLVYEAGDRALIHRPHG